MKQHHAATRGVGVGEFCFAPASAGGWLLLLGAVGASSCAARERPHDESGPEATASSAALSASPASANEPMPPQAGAWATGALGVTLPGRLDGPLQLTAAVCSASVVALDVAPVEARRLEESKGAVVVYRDARLDTDIRLVTTRDGVEELRVLRSPRAPTVARYRLSTSGGVKTVRLREGRIELLDAAGRACLQAAPMFAVDARGARRDLAVDLEVRDGAHLITASLDASGLAHPIVVDPAWTVVASMSVAREAHASVVLADGKVLVAGGSSSGSILKSAEIYDPVANTWSSAGAMSGAKEFPSAALLSDGRVLVVGDATSAEVFTPSTKTWASAGTLSTARALGALLALPSGKVLAVGGSTSEVYDVASNTWGSVAALSVFRNEAVAAWLPSLGRVLIAGGANGGTVWSTGELYDPATSTWSTADTMAAKHGASGFAVLSSGKLVVSSGLGPVSATEVFDPSTKLWTTVSPCPSSQARRVSAALPSSRFMMAGGWETGETSVYDAVTDKWFTASPMATNRYRGSAVVLASGKVLVTGGSTTTGGAYSTVEIFAQVASGVACGAGGDCLSGFCADGVCCDSACAGQCQACNLAGKVGTCSPVLGAPIAPRSPCVVKGGTGPCVLACDGIDTGKCNFPTTSVACGAATCITGTETHVSTCDGAGACKDVATSCGAFVCGATACKTTCGSDADCAVGFYCAGTSCVAKKLAGAACGAPNECASTFCADGVCCDRACSGQCESCDATGKLGTCTVATGAAPAKRTACAGAGIGTPCGIACDGVDGSKCNYPDKTKTCSANGCSAGVETHISSCDGAGKCNDVPRACGAYACGDSGCKSTCAVKADCLAGYVCKGGACVPASSTCTDDLTSTDPDGKVTHCSPYRCGADFKCGTGCSISAECAPGFACDGAHCLPQAPTADAAESGGCTVPAAGASDRGAASSLLLLGALGLAQRRRRGRTRSL